jgi:hypothetical protein
MNPLILPATPLFAVAVAGALLAALGLLLLARQRSLLAGMRLAPPGASQQTRLLVGNLAALPIVALLSLTLIGSGVRGTPRTLLIAGGVAIYIYAGLVVPRRPEMARQREARQLRRLTPGLIAFVRIGLGSFESPLEIMRRYTVRPVARLLPMQELVGEAVRVGAEQRMRPFTALATVARQRDCGELIDMADALAQAEAEGSRIDTVLEAQQATLELILQSEFKRMLRRRTLYLLLMVAVSLVIGILLNLLFVMAGSALLSLA